MRRSQILSSFGHPEVLHKLPIVEMAGRNRVLIENHQGVLGYSLEEISVKMCYGCVCVTGCDLRLLQLSREQLVISGLVSAIRLSGVEQ